MSSFMTGCGGCRDRRAAATDPGCPHLTLSMRARLLGLGLLPTRREPVEAQGRKYGVPYHKVYPHGYAVADLGPADPAGFAGIAADR